MGLAWKRKSFIRGSWNAQLLLVNSWWEPPTLVAELLKSTSLRIAWSHKAHF